MNAAITAGDASVVFPNTKHAFLAQTTSKTNAEKPDRKKKKKIFL